MRVIKSHAALLAAVVLLAACASRPRPVTKPTVAKPVFDASSYLKAASAGLDVFRLEPGKSDLWVLVDAAGPLAGLGHKHAISSHGMEGFALLTTGKLQADVRLPLKALVVDDPAARRQWGFGDTISESAIAGTRAHMLESLDADRYPLLQVHVEGLKSTEGSTIAVGSLYLHGASHAIEVPVDIRRGQTELRVSGSFQLRQTDYGIAPYSALHGALQVADTLHIRFAFIGRRLKGT